MPNSIKNSKQTPNDLKFSNLAPNMFKKKFQVLDEFFNLWESLENFEFSNKNLKNHFL